MKPCSTCLKPMRPIATGGAYCDNPYCGRVYQALPRAALEPTSGTTFIDGRCGSCGSSDTAPFEVNGVERKHCWPCGAVSAREAAHQ